MEYSQKDFQVLDALDSYEIETQRQLAAYAGISLGQVNYILKGLLDKGLVKLGRFRKHPNKIKYSYLLTPKGIETKSRLAVKYVIRRLKKYHSVRQRMANRLSVFEKQGHRRLMLVGPDLICELVESLITEQNFQLELMGCVESWQALRDANTTEIDLVLMFDGDAGDYNKISGLTNIPKDKFSPLY